MLRCMAITQPAKQRAALKRLIRARGLKLVAAALGMSPATVALYQSGEKPKADNQRRIDRAFAELGDDLGLTPPASPAPSRALTPLAGEPRLRLVRDDRGQP